MEFKMKLLNKPIINWNIAHQVAYIIGDILKKESMNQEKLTGNADCKLEIFIERDNILEIKIDEDIPIVNITTDIITPILEKSNTSRQKIEYITKIHLDILTTGIAEEKERSDTVSNVRLKNALNYIEQILYARPHATLGDNTTFYPITLENITFFAANKDNLNQSILMARMNLEVKHCSQNHANDGEILKEIINNIILDPNGKIVVVEFSEKTQQHQYLKFDDNGVIKKVIFDKNGKDIPVLP